MKSRFLLCFCISNSMTAHFQKTLHSSVTPTICPAQVSLREKVIMHPQQVKVKTAENHILLHGLQDCDTKHTECN